MAPLRSLWTLNLLIALVGLALFAAVNARSGRIDANDGLGWDGRQYAHMTRTGLAYGNIPTQTRPLLPLLTRIPYAAGLDVRAAFQFMNFVYAFVLYLGLCRILDLYDAGWQYKVFLIANVALCIATAKMFAFYPTLVDLGALALLTGAIYFALAGRPWISGVATLLAVAAREFSAAGALFGFHRSVRRGQGFATALLAFAPAVFAGFVIRHWAIATNVGDRDSIRWLLSAGNFLDGLVLWREPVGVAFFAYFVVTLLGGVTALLVVRPLWCLRRVADEPELATFAIPLLAVSALGVDVWRYLMFLLPAIAVLFARYVREHQPGVPVLTVAFILTLVTQRPLAAMDMSRYFRDWFPLYPYLGQADPVPDFGSTWTIRFAVVVVGLVVLVVLQQRAARQALAGGPLVA